ncbi:unnamed protein product, partial [Mesorhabditis spiculigera]
MLRTATVFLLPALASCCMRIVEPPVTTTSTAAPITTTTPACATCTDTTQTAPATGVTDQGYYSFGTDAAGCSTATNNCPADGNLRLVTDQGVITIPPTAAESQELTCTGGNYQTVYQGMTYTVTEDICYTMPCASCPTPIVAAGITVTTTYDETSFCKRAQFSGCANGYKVPNNAGTIFTNINDDIPCVDYSAANAGGRWYTNLNDNANQVVCR